MKKTSFEKQKGFKGFNDLSGFLEVLAASVDGHRLLFPLLYANSAVDLQM